MTENEKIELRNTCLHLAIQVNQGQELVEATREAQILKTAEKFHKWITEQK